ncbi:hypothetical protein R3P38DRAFT_1816926 [Favolaschia claudopus]|uniref:DUF6570 domain-containing protein n=1 Tax=Favolaschia claudopus TaxID=2862362 RepID=A0AAW0A4I8_9AGAR
MSDTFFASKLRQQRRRENREATAAQNEFNAQNPVAGPSRIPLAPLAIPNHAPAAFYPGYFPPPVYYPPVYYPPGPPVFYPPNPLPLAPNFVYPPYYLPPPPPQYYFPMLPRGGVPIQPPHWAVEQVPGVDRRVQPPYAAVNRTPREPRTRASGSPTHPSVLPLNGLRRDIRQASPHLQRHAARSFNQTASQTQTPTSRDHRDKRRRTQRIQSPLQQRNRPDRSPTLSDNGQNPEERISFVPRLLFRNEQVNNHQTGLPADVFGPRQMDLDQPRSPPTPPNRPNHRPSRPPLPRSPLGSPHRRNQARGSYGRQPHPTKPDLLWCTKQSHWVHKSRFSEIFLQCDSCRNKRRAREALQRAEREAQRAARQLAGLVDPPDHPPQPPNHENPPEPPNNNNPPPVRLPPLSELAISPEDRDLIKDVRNKIMAISLESCTECHERWFDLNVIDGVCSKCRVRSNNKFKYRDCNEMNPGSIPGPEDLPPLTQMEEIMISPVHALVSLYQIRGGQFKYSGHCCNFVRDTAVTHNKLPLLPQECDVIVMRRRGVDQTTNEDIHQDFRVRRRVVQKWLEYLKEHHPTFRNQIQVDFDRLANLPEDGSIRDQLRTVDSRDLSDDPDEGPPESEGNSADGTEHQPHISNGFVPNINSRSTEIEQLRAAASHHNDPVILTMPFVHATTQSF